MCKLGGPPCRCFMLEAAICLELVHYSGVVPSSQACHICCKCLLISSRGNVGQRSGVVNAIRFAGATLECFPIK